MRTHYSVQYLRRLPFGLRDPAERRFLSKSGLRLRRYHLISGKTETVNLRIEGKRSLLLVPKMGKLFREREITVLSNKKQLGALER